MTSDQIILERLDRIEAQLAPITGSIEKIHELRDDLNPLVNNAFQLITKELEDIESGFNLEDILLLIKKLMRSTRSFIFALSQLENIIDFVTTLEPLLRSSVPQLISYLDELDQKGVFRMLMATLDVRAKVAATYSAEDIDQIGDGFVALLGLAKKLSDPKNMLFLEKITDIPASCDLEGCKDIGPFGLVWAAGNKEVKQGMGVLIELAKAMGRLKTEDETQK